MTGVACDAVTASADLFTRAPRGNSMAEAATVTTAGVTAWRALTVNGPLKAGETVLVQGSGGVSLYALQIAKALGARVTDPSLNPKRMDVAVSNQEALRLRSLGDRPVIVATHSPRWRMEPELPEPLAERLESVTQDLQRRFLELSSGSVQRVAATAGHGLPHEDPPFVSDSILEGVSAVRARQP